MQGQDPRGARLAVRARTEGLSAADVDRALSEERSLLITWLNRGTLHLVRSEDYPWLQALTTPPLLTGNARRLAEEGVSAAQADRGVETIERALAEEGPLDRLALRARLDAAGVPTEGQALVHLLMLDLPARDRRPRPGLRQAARLRPGRRLARRRSRQVDREAALAELARRYLAGHGPAGDRDLARWAGLPLRDARAGLEAIAAELDAASRGACRAGDGAARRGAAAAAPARALRPGAARLDLARGRPRPAHATWSPSTASSSPSRWSRAARWRPGGCAKGKVEIEPLGRISKAARAALDADAADVERFMESH